jgi:hypothetical protein
MLRGGTGVVISHLHRQLTHELGGEPEVVNGCLVRPSIEIPEDIQRSVLLMGVEDLQNYAMSGKSHAKEVLKTLFIIFHPRSMIHFI